MTPPAPRPDRPGPLRLLVWAGVGLVGAAIVGIARVPPPRPPALMQQVAVVHDAMITGRKTVTPPADGAPHYVDSLVTRLQDVRVQSWLVEDGVRVATAHEATGEVPWPRNAMNFRVGQRDAVLFELGDLSVLGWRDETTWIVGGAMPAADLRPLAEWVQQRGPGPAPDDANPLGDVSPPPTPRPPPDAASTAPGSTPSDRR